MKKLFFSILGINAFCLSAYAQPRFKTIDSIDINNIHASVLVHGDMWWNPDWGDAAVPGMNGWLADFYRCNVYGNKNINYAGTIWMGAYDGSNNLHVAADPGTNDSNCYWPGPINGATPITYAESQDWAKIWKVKGTEVQYFNSLSTHTLMNTPVSILTWPGNGNIHARGNGNVSLNVTGNMAPFADLNGNGKYEPLLGEYPDFRGDQALWYIFNDNGPAHIPINANPLGVEVHALVYAYKRGTTIDNVVYYDYTIVNKSANNYRNMRFALADAVDLGWYLDDYIGFDSSWRLGICYNGTNSDGRDGGYPGNSFGDNPPVTGVTLVSLPGDNEVYRLPAGSFIYYNNDNSLIGDPDPAHLIINTC